MKTIKHLFLAVIATTILSCSNDDDNSQVITQCDCQVREDTYLPNGGDIILQESYRENMECELNNTETTETLPSGRTKITSISDCKSL